MSSPPAAGSPVLTAVLAGCHGSVFAIAISSLLQHCFIYESPAPVLALLLVTGRQVPSSIWVGSTIQPPVEPASAQSRGGFESTHGAAASKAAEAASTVRSPWRRPTI